MVLFDSAFHGFSRETIQFLYDLRNNNNKLWFEENRHIFDEIIMPEAKHFVVAMGDRLLTLAPNIVAIPKTDKSIFRIYRDTRFSGDKRPYKTHLGIFFWEGPNKKLENTGFYFHLEPERLFLGVGLYIFPKHLLEYYRDSVVDDKYGATLVKAIQTIQKNPSYRLGWKKYKRIPSGYDPQHPNADLLLYGGMGFEYQQSLPEETFSEKIVDFCFKIFKDMTPIHTWLREFLERVAFGERAT